MSVYIYIGLYIYIYIYIYILISNLYILLQDIHSIDKARLWYRSILEYMVIIMLFITIYIVWICMRIYMRVIS